MLGLSVAGNLRPTLAFLRTEANISRAALARTLANNPQVLGQSVDTSLRPTLAFFRELGVPEPELGRCVPSRPPPPLPPVQSGHVSSLPPY